MRFLVTAITAVSLLVLSSCGSDDGDTQQAPEDLWERTFISTAITEDGEPRPLVDDARIRLTFPISLSFEAGLTEVAARWRAGCNSYGGAVKITAERLLVSEISGTQVGCSDALHEQDEWLTEFFGADPQWHLRDDRVTLTSNETVIELQATR